MAQKVIRTGNSVAVTIPSEFARDLGIRVGDQVKVRLDKGKGKIVFTFSGAKQLLLAEDFLQKRRQKLP